MLTQMKKTYLDQPIKYQNLMDEYYAFWDVVPYGLVEPS
jgi:hypothetical protein